MFIWTKAQAVTLPVSFLIIVMITVVLTILLKNKTEKVRKVPFIIIASVMLILEVIKQILSITDYNLWNIPLHFCSTFMFWFAIASFCKGKLQHVGFSISVASGILFLIMFYIDPTSIIGSSSNAIFLDFFSFHTFFYHHLIILFLILSFALKLYKPQINHLLFIFMFFSLYSVIAIFLAHKLNINFTNLLFSNISFMQALLNKTGYVIYTLVMYLVGLLTLFVITIMGSIVYNKKQKNKG